MSEIRELISSSSDNSVSFIHNSTEVRSKDLNSFAALDPHRT